MIAEEDGVSGHYLKAGEEIDVSFSTLHEQFYILTYSD